MSSQRPVCLPHASVSDLYVLASAIRELCVVSWHLRNSHVLAETRVSPVFSQRDSYVLASLGSLRPQRSCSLQTNCATGCWLLQ